jgi:prolipoprotein diacylglyceryltransferase
MVSVIGWCNLSHPLEMILYKKFRDRLKNGFFFGLGSVLFVTARFLIEFVKENQVGFEDEMAFNMGQLLSLPFTLVGIGFIIYGLKRTKSSAHNR